MLKYKQEKVVEVSDWDKLVKKTYKKPYSFQQQDGCKQRGIYHLTVPAVDNDEDFPDTIPEVVNGEEMGVKFKVWKKKDPKKHSFSSKWENELFWERNFYPDIQAIANDLYERGLIEAGDYIINIDW